MSSEIKELLVSEYERPKRVMYIAKEMLLSSDRINIIASTKSSGIASIASETLARLGYVVFENVQTLTEVRNDRRSIRLIITLKKTENFKKLYDENQELKKQKEAERKKEEKEGKEGKEKKETTKKK